VGVADERKYGPQTPLVFQVWGDGKQLWHSDPVKRFGEPQNCDIELSAISHLELRVECPGDAAFALAVWCEPRLLLDSAKKGKQTAPKDVAANLNPPTTPDSKTMPSNTLVSKGALVPLSDPFPSGNVYKPEDFKVKDTKLPAVSQDEDRGLVVLKRRDDSTCGMAYQVGGRPHGVTVATYENQQPMLYLTYDDGSRNGLMKSWNESGSPQLFSQYMNGRKHGLSCYYGDDGKLAAVLDYQLNNLSTIRLIQEDGVTGLEYASEQNARDDSNAEAILASIEAIEDQIMQNEQDFRRQIRREERDYRQQLAAELSVVKRANIQARANARAIQHQRDYENIIRAHLGR
jgi:hypothetical protein